jgi:hypothetical protein
MVREPRTPDPRASKRWLDPATLRRSEAHRLRKSAAYVSAPCHEVKPRTREITAFFGLLQVPREPSVLVEASILPSF